jgi:hypothetical protein
LAARVQSTKSVLKLTRDKSRFFDSPPTNSTPQTKTCLRGPRN